MKRMSSLKEAAQEARWAAARDMGREHYPRDPEALLVTVHRLACSLFSDKEAALAFVEGFTQARAQREAYLKESAR
jgi:predicted RNA polymerase sigma factor